MWVGVVCCFCIVNLVKRLVLYRVLICGFGFSGIMFEFIIF